MVMAKDDDALVQCTSLNLPCFDARALTPAGFLQAVISRGYDVHLAQLGNSYISNIDATLAKFVSENGNVDVVGAQPSGDVFVRSNDRTKAAVVLWAKTTSSPSPEDSKVLFNIDMWPALDLTKASFTAQRYCDGSSSPNSPLTKSTSLQTPSSAPSISDKIIPEKDTSSNLVARSPLRNSPSFAPDAGEEIDDTPTATKMTCGKGFYVSISCKTGTTPTETKEQLKALGAWHLTECNDKEHCDRQQVVPKRWVQSGPDLAAFGGIC